MQTILVLGANGFVGSHTLRYLSQQNNVRVIAACRDKRKIPFPFNGETREGDLRDRTYVKTLFEDVDSVVNAMAWSSLWGHKQQSRELFLEPIVNLIDEFNASDTPRLVNVSTTAAAAPKHSSNAQSKGIMRPFWPHLCNVVRIENKLRDSASSDKSVINLRLGIFVGENYGIGILPILVPRLKTHLVPWVSGGNTRLDLVDGRDCGQALGRAALAQNLEGFQSFNIVGKESPSVREIIMFLHQEFGLPKPHFSVPFWMAYPFAWLMEAIDPIVPWDPLIVRSIIHLLEETGATHERATKVLGYCPQHEWKDAVRIQLAEMSERQTRAMRMAKPIT